MLKLGMSETPTLEPGSTPSLAHLKGGFRWDLDGNWSDLLTQRQS